jgi:transglutaminase-like putative cysteine protease
LHFQRTRLLNPARVHATALAGYFLLALPAIASAGQGKADSRYDVIPPPAWVVPADLPAEKSADLEMHKGGADYVLVDHQVRLDAAELDYARFVVRLTNVSGIEEHSQISISFDPKVEQLHLHSVFIKRGSQLIDQLRNGRVRVIQRENNLEDQLVDGELTFHLLMADVRVGDTVDYSYTRERRNLEWGSRSFGRFQTQWSDPVGYLRIRISTPVGSSLKTLSHPEEAPKTSIASGVRILEWSKLNVAPLRHESDAPNWFQQYSAIEYSQFSGWGQIVEASLPLYRVSAAPSNELKELTKRLAATGSTDAERAVAAVRFVQEEIRYTGIEEGEGAFRPTAPNEVLARRYGDCKDKTLLAVTLLRALGIEAMPALVSTHWKGEVRNHLPSPGLMNHVVARAVIAGKTYWFDATATGQGGRLANFTQAGFGEALVISPGVTDLEPMPTAGFPEPLIKSQSVFDLRAGLFVEASLNVTTTYLGAEADSMRRKLRATGAADLGQKYLHYYKGQYADTRSAGPLQVKDEIEDNELTLVESYKIKDVFETDKRGKQKFYVNADRVTDALAAPDLPERTTPLAIDFPKHLVERVELLLPVAWNVDADTEEVDTEFFRYNSKVAYLDKQIRLDYEFESLKDHVPVAQLPAYIKQLGRARDDTYYHIFREPGTTELGAPGDSHLAFKVLGLLGGAFLAILIGRHLARRHIG